MKFHYAGKFDGDVNKLPKKQHHPNAIAFKEVEDMKKVSIIANIGAIVLMVILAILFLLLGLPYMPGNGFWLVLASICGILVLVPHELLHAICYKEDVYMYTDLKHGLMFVVGTEDMSKAHFISMCLCPNIVLGFIPYGIFLFFPHLVGLGLFGIICIESGFGDYINVYNAITQMPRHAKTYMSGMHSYWYE